jgi:hypothetical protein
LGGVYLHISDDDIEEIKQIICWAISEGYDTNEATKSLVKKLQVDPEWLAELDNTCNIGIKLLDE